MKKQLLLSILFLGLISCAKDNKQAEIYTEIEEPTFTASIETTKTTIEGKKVSWVIDDIIKINGVDYKVSEVTSTGAAKFVKVNKGAKAPTAPYTAVYGDVTNQVYNPEYPGSNCPMVSEETSQTNLVFSASTGVLKLNVKSAESVNLTKISVGDYSLNFNTSYELTSQQSSFYIAIPNGVVASSDSPLQITFVTDGNKDNVVKTYKPSTAYEFSAGHLKPITISKSINFGPKSTLPGEFVVNADGKKVKFAKGNLWCDASNSDLIWGFEDDQFTASQTTYNSSHVDHFFYRTDGGYQLDPEYLANYQQVDWGKVAFSASTKWTTLSKSEWEYLTDGNKHNDWAVFSNINGKKAFLLMPTSFEWNVTTMGEKPTLRANNSKEYNSANATAIENAGGVFLVFAGQRTRGATSIGYTHIGYYGEYSNMYTVKIATGSLFSCGAQDGSNVAYSIRLVYQVN